MRISRSRSKLNEELEVLELEARELEQTNSQRDGYSGGMITAGARINAGPLIFVTRLMELIQTGPFGIQLFTESDYWTKGVPVVMRKISLNGRITIETVASCLF